jgi:hypothetical protein
MNTEQLEQLEQLKKLEKLEKIKAARRETVSCSYNAAKAENKRQYLEGDPKATEEYIFPNQFEDSAGIVNNYYTNKCRVGAVVKRTKVGADGLMIAVATQMTTHPDDKFVVNPANVRIITGMSNASWEKDMKDKSPSCFKKNIFHHGQLQNADLRGLRDSLIIIDELDTGDKDFQVLHTTLLGAGLLNVTYMNEYNIRFLFISATMVKELYELYCWGELYFMHRMTIPKTYIGHIDFLERGIIQEFYPLTTAANASKWVQEDVLDNYGDDFRIHIVRTNLKTSCVIQTECIKKDIECRNHTSSDKIEEAVLREIFEGPRTRHIVLLVKGFYRRANLIPNEWKMRIGAVHELHTKMVDNNVQIQGLAGRMTGYWRPAIEEGHKTGPYRTSVLAVQQYDAVYNDPFGQNSYNAAGFKKNHGKVTTCTGVFVNPKNIVGLVAGPKPDCGLDEETEPKKTVPIVIPMSLEEIERIHKLKSSHKLKSFHKQLALSDILKQYLRTIGNHALAERIDGFDVGQITRPGTEGARKRNVDDPVKAAQQNKKFTINVKDKIQDSWQAVLDDRGLQVIFMIYCSP